jgi:hypothetical protein
MVPNLEPDTTRHGWRRLNILIELNIAYYLNKDFLGKSWRVWAVGRVKRQDDFFERHER